MGRRAGPSVCVHQRVSLNRTWQNNGIVQFPFRCYNEKLKNVEDVIT